jgi:hypothetical protein
MLSSTDFLAILLIERRVQHLNGNDYQPELMIAPPFLSQQNGERRE